MRSYQHLVLIVVSAAVSGGEVVAQDVDTILVGSAALRNAVLRAGTYTMESFRRADGVETRISVTRQSVGRSRAGATEVYVIHTTHASVDGDTTVGVIVARATDFALVHQRVRADRDSAAVAMADGYVTGWVALPGEPVLLLDQRLAHAVFPVEGQIPWLFPLLPLRSGFAAAVPHYSPWSAGEEWSTIRVVGSDVIALGAREVDCWVVDGGELFPGYTATYWIDKGTRRVVQGVARGAEGGPEFWSRMRSP